jgi:putative chitinase
MLPINADLLWAVAPSLPGERGQNQSRIITAVGAVLQETLERYDISTRLRIAHFVSQTCHESASFSTTEEFASGSQYEGRGDLGNTQPGDGRRYKGRGLLQLTGHSNYRKYGQILGIDLEGDPVRAADPVLSLQIACEYWKSRDINPDCDRNDIITVTKKINGGLNGLAQRREFLAKALDALSRIEAMGPGALEHDSRPLLRRGSRGDAVAKLQTLLRQAGIDLLVDGDFGPATEVAVTVFQRDHALVADGVVGPMTWDALEHATPVPAAVTPSVLAAVSTRFFPVGSGYVITSPFGPRDGGFHTGVDFGWPGGSSNKPVYAVQSGTVIHSGAAQGYGGPDPAGWLVIDSSTSEGGGCVEYGHIVREVEPGAHVTAGQRIAHINPSSNSNGGVAPHLHLAVMPREYNPSTKMDPLPWLGDAQSPEAVAAPVLVSTVNGAVQ